MSISPAPILSDRQQRRQDTQKAGLPSKVAGWYYKHGLFLSSYPTCATSIAIVVVVFSCIPLLNIPLPGTIPTKVILPYTGEEANNDTTQNAAKNFFNLTQLTFEPPFPWARSDPFVYVQQITLRTLVAPWQSNMIQSDAFRAPLFEVFKLIEAIRNHEDNESNINLGDICLHVENVKRPTNGDLSFPEYNCLVLSPANFWQQSPLTFNKDDNVLNTIFQHHNIQKTKISTAEMLFGMPMRDTGLKRYPIRVRPRIIQYAVTLVLRENNQSFLSSLKEKLTELYPLHQPTEPTGRSSVMYVYYPGEFNALEFLPLLTAFVLLFMYVYFSVRKIEIIKSRLVLATCAVITVLSSLLMSLGLCFFFGLTISMQSKGVFPYLVILVGLENVLVITKSVVSTDDTFDVKIRVAQGLSKEGWSISKTLLTEITILTIGLATFVPVIQEFCIFAIVGLMSDFFLQMLLFSTVLAMDIKRIELSAEAKHIPKMVSSNEHHPRVRMPRQVLNRSRSHPKLSGMDQQPTDVVAPSQIGPADKKIPKRLIVVNFWARTRLFQRAFMVWMIVWISSIIYNSDFFENIFLMEKNSTTSRYSATTKNPIVPLTNKSDDLVLDVVNARRAPPKQTSYANAPDEVYHNITEQIRKLRHPDYETNVHLSNFHWSTILKQYNISLSGRYVTVLPTIRLSHAVQPEVAIDMRNHDEKPAQHFQWKALAVALDPIDFSDRDPIEVATYTPGNTPLYPKSPMEIFLATILCAISVFVLTYTMVVFYRCICTRNYAEWRSSWNENDVGKVRTQRVMEGIPIRVRGHDHRIECLAIDNNMVATSCLEGDVKIWDARTGENIAFIVRNEDPSYKQYQDKAKTANDYNSRFEYSFQRLNKISKEEPFGPNVAQVSFRSPVWCLDFLDNLIVIGCADGRLEFWEGSTGNLKCIYEGDHSTNRHGITNVHLAGDRVVAARLSGRVDFLRLETYNQGRQIDWGFTSAYRRTHVRTGSTGSIALSSYHHPSIAPPPHTNSASVRFSSANVNNCYASEEIRCLLELQHQGHQQPITCMSLVGGTVFTGSQDHTLKVFKLEKTSLVYTLHGHCGPITCLFIDHFQSGTGGSGSQDGLLCVWDLITGACMYSIEAHDGAIVGLVCAPSYVISLGADERLCVWERFQGHLLNTINVTHPYTSLLMLTPSLLVTGKQGSLIVWDVRTGEPTREVRLDCANLQLCPRIITVLPDCGTVICDYGCELRIVNFPLVADKCD